MLDAIDNRQYLHLNGFSSGHKRVKTVNAEKRGKFSIIVWYALTKAHFLPCFYSCGGVAKNYLGKVDHTPHDSEKTNVDT